MTKANDMQPTLDRDVAEAIYKIVGEYETAQRWAFKLACLRGELRDAYLIDRGTVITADKVSIPAPDFGETIRIIVQIDKKRDGSYDEEDWLTMVYCVITQKYMFAPSPEQGMAEVSNYLRKILCTI